MVYLVWDDEKIRRIFLKPLGSTMEEVRGEILEGVRPKKGSNQEVKETVSSPFPPRPHLEIPYLADHLTESY
jgi:hypothetical protein